MRKLLRNMAKAQLRKTGAGHVNKVIRNGRWRQFVGAYLIDTMTGKKMKRGYHGQKKYRKGSYKNHLFSYSM